MSPNSRKIRLIMELRSSGVTDTAVLAAMERIQREDFVPEAFRDRAYDPRTLPIGCGQTVSSCWRKLKSRRTRLPDCEQKSRSALPKRTPQRRNCCW